MLTKLFTVWCDGARAPYRPSPLCRGWIGNEDSGSEARELARTKDWARIKATGPNDPGRDLCPYCRALNGVES